LSRLPKAPVGLGLDYVSARAIDDKAEKGHDFTHSKQRRATNVFVRIPSPSNNLSNIFRIETEQALVNANRELIARFKKKIQAVLARVNGEDGPDSSGA
jgi:hypothetical protein